MLSAAVFSSPVLPSLKIVFPVSGSKQCVVPPYSHPLLVVLTFSLFAGLVASVSVSLSALGLNGDTYGVPVRQSLILSEQLATGGAHPLLGHLSPFTVTLMWHTALESASQPGE